MRATISHSWKLQAWVAIGLVLIVVGFGVGAVGLWSNSRDARATDTRICARINTLDMALLTILNRSLTGLPANLYYRRHPDELAVALRNTRYAIAQLQRARCTPS